MKKNSITLFLALMMALVTASCHKTKDPEVVNDHVQVFSDHALFTWDVEFDGSAASVVELGTAPDLANAQRYGSETLVEDKRFTVTVYNLSELTTYYYRFVTTDGKASYESEIQSFNTPQQIVPLPATREVDFTWNSAVFHGELMAEGTAPVTEVGFCWGTNPEPNFADCVFVCDSVTPAFMAEVTGLSPTTTYYVRAFARNANGDGFGETKSFQTPVGVDLPVVNLVEVNVLLANTALCVITVTDDGGEDLMECGVCWSTGSNPTVEDAFQAADEAGVGTFTISVSGLSPGKLNNIRAYARNSAGVSYSEVMGVETPDGLPTVVTRPVVDLSDVMALCAGEIVDEGHSEVIERGICWSVGENPSVDGRHVIAETAGLGDFTCSLTRLNPETTYHIRAYGMNAFGVAYGDDITFMTMAPLPKVVTTEVSSITSNSASSGGNVVDDAGLSITERGICWSTNRFPTINDNHDSDHNYSVFSISSYDIEMTGLLPNTTYYVRAYVVCDNGVGYGEEVSFTTLSK